MRGFFWKFVLCLTPCILAGWVTAVAVAKYQRGEPGGFKLGVDLVGGTILVYEIDFRKQALESGKEDSSPLRDTAVLAEALKRRIDPNDLFNIVIRPSGGEGRVEIILPTGGTHRAKVAEEAWQKLLTAMDDKQKKEDERWESGKLDVPRGHVQELAERIHFIRCRNVWEKDLFQTKDSWKHLLDEALKPWDHLEAVKDKLYQLPVGNLTKFAEFVQRAPVPEDSDPDLSDAFIDRWIKQQAWEVLLQRVQKKWPELQAHKDELSRITPDSNEQLTTFIMAKGNVVGQAALTSLEPFLGHNPVSADFPEYAVVSQFLQENYGPSLKGISEDIKELYEQSGHSRDLTVEEVQRIKDLVSRVGSLEFRILAN